MTKTSASHIAVRLYVTLDRSDVQDIIGRGDGYSIQWQPELERPREDILTEVDRSSGRNQLQQTRVEHVDSRVCEVACCRLSARLLNKVLDLPTGVDVNNAAASRIVDLAQDQRAGGAAVMVIVHERTQVNIGQHIAVEDDERFREIPAEFAACSG